MEVVLEKKPTVCACNPETLIYKIGPNLFETWPRISVIRIVPIVNSFIVKSMPIIFQNRLRLFIFQTRPSENGSISNSHFGIEIFSISTSCGKNRYFHYPTQYPGTKSHQVLLRIKEEVFLKYLKTHWDFRRVLKVLFMLSVSLSINWELTEPLY